MLTQSLRFRACSAAVHFSPMAAASQSAAAAAMDAQDAADAGKIDYKSLPPINIAIRSRLGVEFRTGPFSAFTPTTGSGLRSDAGAEGQVLYSADGKLVAIVSQKNVQIIDTNTLKTITTINRGRIEHLWFSPAGSYLATWDRKLPDSKAVENLVVWNCKDGRELLKLHWNDLDATQSRPVQWTWDEAYVTHLTTNEVKWYPAANPSLSHPSHRLHVKGVAQFALAPMVKPYQVATFLPSKGTDPARVNIYSFPLFGVPAAAAAAAAAAASSSAASSEGAAHPPQPTASKSFFKAEEITLKWSPTGAACLIETRTSTDKTGKSYYGESGLHLLYADGSYQGTVPFGTNPGPIQDVQWSPTGKEFMVIQGFQPAKSTLFVASNCTPIREYGSGSINTIRWSPHGRFVMLGGFGNLAGELQFWDSFKFKLMGKAIDRDGAKSFEWTPDGRFFITASLRPWRRVDNGYKIWSYAGEPVYAEKYDELYQVLAQPAPQGLYPNRPQSPRLTDKRKAAAASGVSVEPAKPSAYIPPHLRAQGATAPSAIMKRETDSAPRKLNQQERAAITGEALPAAAAGAGAGDHDGSLSKNQLKRAKMKANAAKKFEEEKAAAEAAEAERLLEAARKQDLSDPANVARKIKALQKKMRAITDLKEKEAQGVELNEDQKLKIAGEAELEEEMKQLTLLAKAE